MVSDIRSRTEEDKLVHELVAKHQREFPIPIKKIDVRYGEDSSGDPAIWILLFMEREPTLSKEKLSRLDDVIRNLKSELQKAGVERWPIFKFEVA